MKYALEVCLVALTLACGTIGHAAAQEQSSSQPMQRGISVQLPVTRNAVPVPKADNEGAPVIAITSNGATFLGVEEVSMAELPARVNQALSTRTDKTLYIKADARAACGNLIGVVDALRAAGIEKITFLAVQPGGQTAGTLAPPTGIEMQFVPSREPAGNSSRLD